MIADAVRSAVHQATKEAVQAALSNPQVLQALQAQHATPTPTPSTPSPMTTALSGSVPTKPACST